MNSKQKFVKDMTNKWKFMMFSLTKLPSLVFWGIRFESFSEEKSVTTVKYGWSNTNPFKSMCYTQPSPLKRVSPQLLLPALLPHKIICCVTLFYSSGLI